MPRFHILLSQSFKVLQGHSLYLSAGEIDQPIPTGRACGIGGARMDSPPKLYISHLPARGTMAGMDSVCQNHLHPHSCKLLSFPLGAVRGKIRD